MRERVRDMTRLHSTEVLSRPRLEELINEAYQAVCEGADWPFLRYEQTVSTVAGTKEYNLDATLEVIRHVVADLPDSDTPWPLDQTDIQRIEFYADEVDQDTPVVYARKGDSASNDDDLIVFAPIPDDAYNIKVVGRIVPAALSLDTDEPIFESRYHRVVAYAASAVALDEEGMHGESEAMDARASDMLDRMYARYMQSHDDSMFVIGGGQAGPYRWRGRIWPERRGWF